MLTEIEEKLAEILRQKIAEIPKENIVVNTELNKPPAVMISNLKFKFEKADMAENFDTGKVNLEEKFSGDGVGKTYKLQEEPLRNSVRVESPPGTSLTEKQDYTVDDSEHSVNFQKAPEKGKNNIIIKYNSQKSVMTLKTIKVKALYLIGVLGENRTGADSLAEKVVKALLEAEERLAEEGIEIRPLGGANTVQEKNAKVHLTYVAERTIRLEQVIGPMEKIEITRKNI
jgi:hypothetical protein